MAEPRYWVNTVSLDHVEAGVAGGFTQADHGADTRLRQLCVGDGIVFYSPRSGFRAGPPLQRFTAIGVVTEGEPYQVAMTADFHPWRMGVRFLPAGQAEARPLVPHLSFITDPSQWGLPFRRGLIPIPEKDFVRIATAMDTTWPTL